MRNAMTFQFDIKHFASLCVGLLVLAGCCTPERNLNQPLRCEVHGVTMTRRTVPIAYGMIPMSKVESERGPWRQRIEHYPNPGDCLPATGINVSGETRAIVSVCRQCEAAKREFDAKAARPPQ